MLLLDLVVMRGAHHHAVRAPCVRASFGGQWVRSPRLTMQPRRSVAPRSRRSSALARSIEVARSFISPRAPPHGRSFIKVMSEIRGARAKLKNRECSVFHLFCFISFGTTGGRRALFWAHDATDQAAALQCGWSSSVSPHGALGVVVRATLEQHCAIMLVAELIRHLPDITPQVAHLPPRPEVQQQASKHE